MNALAQPAAPIPQTAAVALLRTLVLCDLVNSTALVERLGDQRAAELFRKHDRLARALLSTHGGREIDKTDGFLLMFDRPVQAVAFALDYQRALKQLGASEAVDLAARVGIHVGDVVAWDNAADDIANGAKPIEIEGLVKPITSRLMQLALPNQILLSGVAYALAHRAQGEFGSQLDKIRWRTHGRYRFKGIPDPIPVFEVGEEDFAPLKAPPWSGKAHREVPFWRRPATLGIELFVLFALLVIPAWYLLKPEPAIAFAQRDWVVVGDLKNLTGQAAFDDSIETAFRIGLEQSRYVNVLSDLKTRDTIKRMQRDPDATAVDRAIGSEIAIRDGARALILPTIAEIGGRVRITAEVIDPHTQTTVYSESADGVGEASVLPSLDQVNQKLRVRLGEALATVSKESQPLEKVATKNLDALHAFTLGKQAASIGHFQEALTFHRRATALDPEFALAHAETGRALNDLGQTAEALEEIKRASATRERLSPRDALFTDALLASFGPPLPASEKWKLLSSLYPDFFSGHGAYAMHSWQRLNDYATSITEVKKSASNKNPNSITSKYLLAVLYLGTERYDQAEQLFDQTRDIAAPQFHAGVYAATRQFAKAETLLKAALPTKPALDVGGGIYRAAIAIDQGRWSVARSLFAELKPVAAKLPPLYARRLEGAELSTKALFEPSAVDSESFGTYLAHLQSATAGRHVASDLEDVEFHRLLAAYIAAHIGNTKAAQQALSSARKNARDPNYPVLGNMRIVAEAELARSTGRPDRALELLRTVTMGNELYVTHVALMDAYADSGNNSSALDEAKWLASHRGRAYTEYGSEWVLLPFNVAQSAMAPLRASELALAAGKKSEAREYLSEFQKSWGASSDSKAINARAAKVMLEAK